MDIGENLLRMFSVVMLILALLFTPVLLISLKNNQTTQSLIEKEVVEFVDDVRATGYIDYASYKMLLNRLASTGNGYEVKITHSRRLVSTDGSDYFYDYNTADILDELVANSRYGFSNGDYLNMTVYNTTKTMGSRFLGVILNIPSDSVDLYYSYGGAVRNIPEV